MRLPNSSERQGELQMAKIVKKLKEKTWSLLFAVILLSVFGGYSAATHENYKSEDQSAHPPRRYCVNPWSFGVMGDTQWTLGTPGKAVDPEGTNPNFVSVSVVRQLNEQFIKHGVKFVIQLGDLTNWGGDAGIASRAEAAADLYKHGIGFFPMRGNHETYGSFYNLDPGETYSIPAIRNNFPQTRGLSNTFGAKNFNSPTELSADLDGISYSFDYGPSGSDARFVILDTMATKNSAIRDWYKSTGVIYGYPIGAQQAWISSRIEKNNRGTKHAFFFTHQPLIAETHYDSPFGGYTDSNLDEQNAFFAGLQKNDIRYYISAHDHVYHRSIISSPDGRSKVAELIASPACPKFYTPAPLDHANWKGQKGREKPLSQELGNIGYYIYTVDGPRVTVDYYADEDDHFKSDAGWPNSGDAGFTPNVTPKFNFALKETWGYGLNGKEFEITQGAPYTSVVDAFNGTTARILSGLNHSTAVDGNSRRFIKAINTGWTANTDNSLISSIFTLWGMANPDTNQTDTYTLSLTFSYGRSIRYGDGKTGIATLDSKGKWVNAVDMNYGGVKKFVQGPWKTGYGLGTYGIDPAAKTAWAVINYSADFAVARILH
jgi:hypothetical protein